MNKIGIIGAMELEVDALKKELRIDGALNSKVTQIAGMDFLEGDLNDVPVVIVRCGIGKVNAALCVQILCDHYHVTHVINTGVAGSLNAALDIGDILISKDAMYHDMDVTPLGYEPGIIPQMDMSIFPADERLALMEKYRATVNKYDPCILRYAYTLNAVGRYAEAHEILTTRRFHVWEGANGLLAPFVEACIGLGKEAMAKGDFKTALKFFEESTTYPENLQAGRPGDAGTEPKSRYYMAQCKKALGDEAGCKAELENSLKGWIHAGE
ncbi:MAG: 5'-methylthioadenosine/S-adenosylhomocysteine nucleosidase, partial [Lachnospiraceae bacterium]|nr:5'-methylthioadenosine/S-adenosylhomocysteine nucleosidase [Lachnospiraceae bacterium]